jgi:hypothetical protein
MLKRTISRGHDSPGHLTVTSRLYLSRAQSGEPFFNAGRAPRIYLYSTDTGAGPSNGGLSRLWVTRRAAGVLLTVDRAVVVKRAPGTACSRRPGYIRPDYIGVLILN